MITYRRNKNGREYFRIEGNDVHRILIKLKFVRITKFENDPDLVRDLLTDESLFIPCKEETFNAAYKEAFSRIALMKIV